MEGSWLPHGLLHARLTPMYKQGSWLLLLRAGFTCTPNAYVQVAGYSMDGVACYLRA